MLKTDFSDQMNCLVFILITHLSFFHHVQLFSKKYFKFNWSFRVVSILSSLFSVYKLLYTIYYVTRRHLDKKNFKGTENNCQERHCRGLTLLVVEKILQYIMKISVDP
jgi:hypothetical protein